MSDPLSVNVTITIPMWIDDIPEGVSLEQAAQALTHDHWSDGRHPFTSEMIHEGLRSEVQFAFRAVLGDLLREQYGHEMVPRACPRDTNGDGDCDVCSHERMGHGCTARWLIESEKIKGPYAGVSGHISAAKIEVRDD